jgi:hypothetical protein
MKNGRSPGIDNITAEMIKAAREIGTIWINLLIFNVWMQKEISQDWGKEIKVPIFKKGDRKACNNYRGVTLISQCAKLYEKIIEIRLKRGIENNLREEKWVFRADFS